MALLAHIRLGVDVLSPILHEFGCRQSMLWGDPVRKSGGTRAFHFGRLRRTVGYGDNVQVHDVTLRERICGRRAAPMVEWPEKGAAGG